MVSVSSMLMLITLVTIRMNLKASDIQFIEANNVNKNSSLSEFFMSRISEE